MFYIVLTITFPFQCHLIKGNIDTHQTSANIEQNHIFDQILCSSHYFAYDAWCPFEGNSEHVTVNVATELLCSLALIDSGIELKQIQYFRRVLWNKRLSLCSCLARINTGSWSKYIISMKQEEKKRKKKETILQKANPLKMESLRGYS